MRLEGRLERLEDAARESAAARVRRAWGSLTDGEIAALLAPFVGAEELPDGTVRLSGEPTPEGKAAERKLGEAVPEHVLTSAIGHREGMPDEEVGRRLRELVGPVLRERGTGVRRRLIGMEGGR